MLIIDNVKKMYSPDAGIKKFNLKCYEGQVYSFIGPNGVGKSTILKTVLGVLKPEEGIVLLDDEDTQKFGTQKSIGYMPENVELNERISARELLYLISDYKFNGNYKDQIDGALKRYNLENLCDKPFNKLSLGNKRKVTIIIAFLGFPKLVILDEPTNGVDTLGIINLKQDILEAKSKGCTILVSSHVLDFVNSIADKNIFLQNFRQKH